MADAKLHSLCSVCAKLGLRLGAFMNENQCLRNFHKSLRLLENSAKSGCHLCMLIFTSIASESGTDHSWRVDPDNPVKCAYRNNGEAHLLVKWNLVTRRFKLSSLPIPRLLRRASTILPGPFLLQHDASEFKKRNYSETRQCPLISKVEMSPKSPLVFSKISKWLNSCIKSHQDCYLDSPSILPDRVIDVGGSGELCNPHIYVTDGESEKYAALSYRWGTLSTITTTSKTFASHISGMKMETLPKTLQDAILVSRVLGIQYLWIDALCIIQDSPQDWAEQAGKRSGIT